MSGLRDTVNRTNPVASGSTTYFGTLKYDSLVDNDGVVTPLYTERVALQWAPLAFVKILSTSSTAGEYPAELNNVGGALKFGTGSSGASIVLDGTPAVDPTGFLMLFGNTTGSLADYTFYKVISWNGSTGVTLNRAPGANPSNGETFYWLIDCESLNALFIKAEFSVATGSADLIPIFFDTGRGPYGTSGVSVTMPRAFPGQMMTSACQGFSTFTTQTGATYYHGPVSSVNCAGAIGAKIRLDSAPSNSSLVSLWAAAS